MKNKLNILFLIVSVSVIFSDGDDCPNCYNPIANAGEAAIYSYGCSNSITQICLDGSGSSDYEESMLTYYSLVTSKDIEKDEELTLKYTLYNV